MIETPIVQFGTSRFLQGHVDLFVSEALARNEATGPITIVQTSGSPERAGRVRAFGVKGGFPVRIRGRSGGRDIDETRQVRSIHRGLSVANQWSEIRSIVCNEARYLVSNTSDSGFKLDDAPVDLSGATVPKSFPGKLLALLAVRHSAGRKGLTVMPCELVPRNGDTLKALVLQLAERNRASPALVAWLQNDCLWINSLVDRIVSEPIEPVGAVAEPYALWAIEDQPGFVPPLRHEAVKVVQDLEPYERLKLHILNLSHTVMADSWKRDGAEASMTVREWLSDSAKAADLESLQTAEVLPAFTSKGLGSQAQDYVATTNERFRNPFLDHRIADIHGGHAEKIRRRVQGLIDWVSQDAPPMPRLRALAATA